MSTDPPAHRPRPVIAPRLLATGTQPDRVVFWISGLGNGGAERQLLEVTTRLQQRGRNVFVAAGRSGPRAPALLDAGVPAYVPTNTRATLRGLLGCIGKAATSTTLVTFLYGPNLLGRLLRPFTGTRLVTSLRTIQFGSPLRHRLLRWTRRLDAAWTANSLAARAGLEADKLVVAGRGSVIRNGVDLPQNVESPPDGPFTWLCVGRLRPEKDHETLLRAWSLSRRPPGARLRLVGDGPETARLQDLARILRVDTSVDFVGALDDPDREYRAAHAVVLSSRTEGSPNSVLEAMAHQRPVVATAAGGTPETLAPGAGLLVSPHDPPALADAMTRIMETPSKVRAAMGAAGRAHVETHHDWERVIDQWEALLWP